MKAAVLHEIGGVPRYGDFPDPVAGDGEVVIEVKAVAVETVDKRSRPFSFAKPTRLIQVGESTGGALHVAAESLRTSAVEIYGAANGLNPTTIKDVYGQILQWTLSGELTFDLVKVPLSDIENAWQRTDLRGRGLVVRPGK